MMGSLLGRAAVLGLALVLSSAAIAGEKVGPVEVDLLPVPSKTGGSSGARGTYHGYVEFRVQIRNTAADDRVVHLSYPADRFGGIRYGVMISRTVQVPAGQDIAVSFYQPALGVQNESIGVRVDGEEKDAFLSAPSVYAESYGYGGGSDYVAALLSRSVPTNFADLAFPPVPDPSAASPGASPVAISASSGSPPENPCVFLRSELPVHQWSPNWLGYSCYDAIVLAGKEAEEMPSQVQSAVRRYVECGGLLLIHGKPPPMFWQGPPPDGPGDCTLGFGRVVARAAGSGDPWEATATFVREWAAPAKRPSGSVEGFQSAPVKPSDPNGLLVSGAQVPVRGLFLLVLLFAVGIGPANLWLLARYKRRIWLWWNVPAISFATCLVVVGYSFFSEGWHSRCKNASLTLLDERNHHAATIGYMSCYCPLTPFGGLHLSNDTEATLLANETASSPYYYRRSMWENLRYSDWTDGQRLTSGWVQARVPAYFQVRKNEDRRERLTVEKATAGGITIVNALGADIERLHFADSSGKVYEGRDIAAGATATLSAVAAEPGKFADLYSPRELFARSDWLVSLNQCKTGTALSSALPPGTYLAVLKKSPFLESPLPGADCQDTAAIVYGICKGQSDGR